MLMLASAVERVPEHMVAEALKQREGPRMNRMQFREGPRPTLIICARGEGAPAWC